MSTSDPPPETDATPQLVELLLVEDNPADARLTREVLQETKFKNRLWVVDNGDDAVAFLRQEGKYVDSPRPDVILLDLNLPRKSGQEVLAEIKEDPGLAGIPVVVLTSSDAEEDIARSYELHANCYVQKPLGLDEFVEVVRGIEDFWFGIVKLPRARRSRES